MQTNVNIRTQVKLRISLNKENLQKEIEEMTSLMKTTTILLCASTLFGLSARDIPKSRYQHIIERIAKDSFHTHLELIHSKPSVFRIAKIFSKRSLKNRKVGDFRVNSVFSISRRKDRGNAILVPASDNYGKPITDDFGETIMVPIAAFRFQQRKATPRPMTDSFLGLILPPRTDSYGKPYTDSVSPMSSTMVAALSFTNRPIYPVTKPPDDSTSYIYIILGVAVPLLIIAVVAVFVIRALKKRGRQINNANLEN